MVTGGHKIIAGDALNLVVLLSLGTPTYRHTLVTYTLIDNRTTSTVDRTGTAIEQLNKSCSTIGEGGDTTSPGRSSNHPLPGIGLHDPLHGRQAWPGFNSFYQRVGQICPR